MNSFTDIYNKVVLSNSDKIEDMEPDWVNEDDCLCATVGISIKNIGISHNREHGEGALRISFYDKASMEAAWARLKKYNYTLFA